MMTQIIRDAVNSHSFSFVLNYNSAFMNSLNSRDDDDKKNISRNANHVSQMFT